MRGQSARSGAAHFYERVCCMMSPLQWAERLVRCRLLDKTSHCVSPPHLPKPGTGAGAWEGGGVRGRGLGHLADLACLFFSFVFCVGGTSHP